MAWIPIAKTTPQYVDSNGNPYSGAVLKAYASGTTTPISMATDSTGGTVASSIALNASGYPAVSGSIVIPHVAQDYKLSLYPTQAAADANTGAIWTIDGLKVTDSTSHVLENVTGTDTITATADGFSAYTAGDIIYFVPLGDNTGAVTLNISSLGAGAVRLNGAALTGGELKQGVPVALYILTTTPVFEIFGNGYFDLYRDKTQALSTNTTLTGVHNKRLIEATLSPTLTLTGAATLGVNWYVWVRNAGSGTITIGRATGGDTINGTAANITIRAGRSIRIAVNAAANGFITQGSDEISSLLTTTGDIVYASAANTPARLALGTPGQLLQVNSGGTNVEWATPTTQKVPQFGLIMTIAADTAHDVTIAAGSKMDSTGAVYITLPSAITKQTDAVFTAGTNQGGLFSGSPANNTWYHYFLIRKDSDLSVDVYIDTSYSAANKPAGYTYFAYLGSWLTDGSANLLNQFQTKNVFTWAAKVLDFGESIDTGSPETKTLRVPPGPNCIANVNVNRDGADGLRLYYTGETNAAAANTTAPLASTFDGANSNSANMDVVTDTSGQVKAQTGGGGNSYAAVQFYINLALNIL